MKFQDLIDKKIALIENSPERFISQTEKVQEQLLKDILKLSGQLDTEGGYIKVTKRNLDAIEVITQKLKQTMYEGDYLQAVTELVQDMDKTKTLTDTYFNKIVNGKPNVKMADIYSANRQAAVEALIGESSLDENFLTPVRETLLEAVTNETSFNELVENITLITTGDPEHDGKLARYAKQIASDTFATTERNYTSMLAEELQVGFVRYTGGLVQDSRCFCEQRNGKYFHIKEVREWGKGNVDAGGLDMSCGYPWQGMYLGTNANNIEQWLGGYNCKHSLVFVSEINVPDDVIERALNEGYIKSNPKTQ